MWMWVPKPQDLTMMGIVVVSPARFTQTALLVLSGSQSDGYRRPSLSFCVWDWEHINGITHISVCSVYLFPHHSARKSKPVVFQCNLFIFWRTIWWYDTCSRLLVLGLCFIVLIFQIKLLSVIHTDPGFNADCLTFVLWFVQIQQLHVICILCTWSRGRLWVNDNNQETKVFTIQSNICKYRSSICLWEIIQFVPNFVFTNFDTFPLSWNTEVEKEKHILKVLNTDV